MIYRFKSKATADLMMLGPHGEQVLRLIGKQPASQGIIEVHQMPAAIEALHQAVLMDEKRRSAQQEATPEEVMDDQEPPADAVTLRQRVWPLVAMMTEAQSQNQAIIWGV